MYFVFNVFSGGFALIAVLALMDSLAALGSTTTELSVKNAQSSAFVTLACVALSALFFAFGRA